MPLRNALVGVMPFLCLAGMCLARPAWSATMRCSVRAEQHTGPAEWRKLAKISQADAERIARAALKTTQSTSLVSAELELESGCLVWSFDLKVVNRQGVREVWIDAGNGKVLASRYETARTEAEEQKAETGGATREGR